jgi:hypothetical protein
VNLQEQALREKIANQIFSYADALRDDEKNPISYEERDAYYDAANIVLTGEIA